MEYNKKNMVSDLQEFVEMETPSYNKELLDKFVDYMKNYLKKNLDLESEIIKSDTNGNDLISVFGKGKKILLLMHYDTVFTEGTLKSNPFRIKDDKIYGPGVFDMKAGIIETLYALKYLKENNGIRKEIVFLMTSDEEIDSTFSREIIIQNAKEAEYSLVMEPSLDGKLKTERKGVGTLKLTIHGKAAHAGLDPDKGINAITEAANIIMSVKKSEIPGINFNVIQGGNRTNVIPNLCVMEADLRFSTEHAVTDIKSMIKSIKPLNEQVNIEVEYKIRPPMIKSLKSVELFKNARNIAKNIGIELEETSVSGGSDGNFCSYYAPVLDGLGAVGNGAHSENEFIFSNSLPERSALLAMLIENL